MHSKLYLVAHVFGTTCIATLYLVAQVFGMTCIANYICHVERNIYFKLKSEPLLKNRVKRIVLTSRSTDTRLTRWKIELGVRNHNEFKICRPMSLYPNTKPHLHPHTEYHLEKNMFQLSVNFIEISNFDEHSE